LNSSGKISDGTGPGDRAHVIFQEKELFQLADKSVGGTARSRSLPFTKHLNGIWRSERSPIFRAEPDGRGARITADGELLLQILPGDAPDPFVAATEWANAISREFAARSGGDR
jgi:hypothetical protein